MARDPLYSFEARVYDSAEQTIVAEQLDFAIRHRALRGDEAEKARNVVRRMVLALLKRKRLSDEQRERIRARWKGYVE
jgi:hypothetical protein